MFSRRQGPSGGVPIYGNRAGAAAEPPVALTAPVLVWDVQIGNSPTIAPGTYSGSPTPTLTYTLYRDGSPVAGVTDVDLATAQAYVAQWDGTAGGDNDIGPSLFFRETATNTAGSATQDTNAVVFDDVTRLPTMSIGVSTQGLTLADAGTTVDQWDSTLGGGPTISLAAAAAVNRPTYEASGGVGGNPSTLFDGVNHGLIGASNHPADWTSYEFGFVGERVAYNGATAGLVIAGSSNAATGEGFVIRDNSAAVFRGVVNGFGFINFTTDPDGLFAHYAVAVGGPLGSLGQTMVNGTVEGTVSGAVPTFPAGNNIMLGSRGNQARTNIRVQAWYAGETLSATERQHLRALLTYYTGVAS